VLSTDTFECVVYSSETSQTHCIIKLTYFGILLNIVRNEIVLCYHLTCVNVFSTDVRCSVLTISEFSGERIFNVVAEPKRCHST